jgi:hypothetical protein
MFFNFLTVIPAKAGSHTTAQILDSRLRGNDGSEMAGFQKAP